MYKMYIYILTRHISAGLKSFVVILFYEIVFSHKVALMEPTKQNKI